MFTKYNLINKYRSISIERVSDFLTRKCIEHQCTELQKITFKLEGWSWNLYIDKDYFKIELAFPIIEENETSKRTNKRVAEDACLEVTKLIKILKAHYNSHEYVDEGNDNKLIKYHVLVFSFESYCYNMYDFNRLFNDGLRVILCGYNEYHKLYDVIESKSPGNPIGFRNVDSDGSSESSQAMSRNRIGFV